MRLSLTMVAAVAVLTFGACATAIPHLSQQQLSWAQGQWPSADRESLEHGRSLYVTRCSACHAAPPPSEVDEDELVAEMADRAHLSSQEQELVVRFLQASKSGQKAQLAINPEPARAPTTAAAAN
jgi:cytochrome c553